MKKKYYIAGGYFALRLNEKLKKKMKCEAESYFIPDEGETAEAYLKRIKDEFKKKTADASYDFIVLDFQALLEFADATEEKTEQSFKSLTEEVTRILKKKSISSGVYVIGTNVPKAYIINKQGMPSSSKLIIGLPDYESKNEKVQIIRKYEKHFTEKTGAVYIDTTADHLYKKRAGYKFNSLRYEDDCYKDVCNVICKKISADIKTKDIYKIDKTKQDNAAAQSNYEIFISKMRRDYPEWFIADIYEVISKYLVGSELVDDSFIYDEMLNDKMDIIFSELSKIYVDKLLILDMKNTEYRLGDDNVIYKGSFRYSQRIDDIYEYLRSRIIQSQAGYCIEISKSFIPEYIEGITRPSYGKEYYDEAEKLISHIVRKWPKERIFDKISGHVKADYIAAVLQQNPKRLCYSIFDSPLDRMVMNLSPEMIRKHSGVIAKWYDKSLDSEDKIKKTIGYLLNKELRNSITFIEDNKAHEKDAEIINDVMDSYPDEPHMGKQLSYEDTVPNAVQLYMNQEVTDTIDKVNRLMTPDAVTFILVTDVHYKSVNKKSKKPTEITFQRMLANMKAVMAGTDIDFIINLGDDTDGNFKDTNDLEKISRYILDRFLELKMPYYRVIGNHDTNHYSKNLIDVKTMHDFYTGYLDGAEELTFNPDSEGTEYYMDIPDKGIRMIVLNTQYGELFAYSESTGKWLKDVALDTDYLILLAEHLSCIPTMNMNASPLKNRESVIEALKSHKRNNIIQICGHSHCDYSFTDNDPEYSPWLTIFSNLARCTRRRQYDIGDTTVGHTDNKFGCPYRTGETVSEDCWEVVVLDPEKRKINFVRFGAGEDREFDF